MTKYGLANKCLILLAAPSSPKSSNVPEGMRSWIFIPFSPCLPLSQSFDTTLSLSLPLSLTPTQVNINGAVSFTTGIESYTPGRFPLGDGRVVIAPFWTDIDTSHWLGHGDVMYRQLLQTNLTLPLFVRANEIIRHAFEDENTFSATWMFIATWSSVAYYNSMDPSSLVSTLFAHHWTCRVIGVVAYLWC